MSFFLMLLFFWWKVWRLCADVCVFYTVKCVLFYLKMYQNAFGGHPPYRPARMTYYSVTLIGL